MTPKFNIPAVMKLRDKLTEGLVEHVGTQPEGEEFDRLIDDAYALLPVGIRHVDVYNSLVHLLGTELSREVIWQNAWRLAGNVGALKLHRPVRPWLRQPEDEWMPVQVMEAYRTKNNRQELAYLYRLRILAGSACPAVVWKTWSVKACSYFARTLGFTSPTKSYPYRDGHELVSMRLLANIKAASRSQPEFDVLHCSGSLLTYNRRVLKARAHIKPPCPFSFTHFCYQCPVGYDQCQAGVHSKTYQPRLCAVCNKETWHDPAREYVCVACSERSV